MSNFTTFFPSAGGGGGEGSGINSYAPFSVGTTDNNPQGYIVSTGVYTNPVDNSVWLKTGKTLAPSATYPNATISELSYTGTSYNLASGNITQMVYSDTFIYATFFGSTSVIRQFTLAGVSTGTTYTDTNATRIFWDGTNLNSCTSVSGGFNVRLLNNSLVQQGTIISWTIAGGVNQICTDGTYVYALQSNTVTKRYDSGTFANELSMSTTGMGAAVGIEFYNNQIVISSYNDQKLYFFSTSLGAPISSVSTTGIGAVAYLSKSASGALWSSSYTVQTTLYEFNTGIGDGTARTDSSGSAQPLFIKIK